MGGAGGISTRNPPGNGRGVTRIKTGNQTGDCPVQDSAEIKAFKVLRRLISAAFFQRKSKKRGENSGKRRQRAGRRKAGGGTQAQGAHGEDCRRPAGGSHDGAGRAGGRGCAAREGLPEIPAEKRAGAGGGGSLQRNVCLAESKGM